MQFTGLPVQTGLLDKIWYRNPSKSEAIGRCGGDEKTEWPRKTDKKSNAKKKPKKLADIL